MYRWLNFLVWIAVLACPQVVRAHEGPPFPILMDEPAGDYVVSVWADPDIGEALFYVIVETPSGKPPTEIPRVTFTTEPVSGRLQSVEYPAEQQQLRGRLQFEIKPYFDRGEMWNVHFHLAAPDGLTHNLSTEVEATPPGFGVWDLAVYLFPFVFLGGFWAAALIRRSRMKRQAR